MWNKTRMDLKRRKNCPAVDIGSTVQQREPGPVLQVEDHPHLRLVLIRLLLFDCYIHKLFF